MNTKTETTITEGTPDEAAIAAEKATQAETAAESAKAAAATVTQQAAAIAADAQQRAAAQVEQAKAQTGEIAQWTKSQIDQFHTRLTSLETGPRAAAGETVRDPEAERQNSADGRSDSGGSGTRRGRRKRGRPPGSKTKTASQSAPRQKAPLHLAGIETILLSCHSMLAAIVQAPELELAEAEAKALARGIETVAKHYPVELSPKRLAWGNLTLVAGSIYGPRAILLFQRARGNVADVAPTAMAMPRRDGHAGPGRLRCGPSASSGTDRLGDAIAR